MIQGKSGIDTSSYGMTAPPSRLTIAVGLSGGVDSAVALHLLKDAGFNVFGLYMKNWEEDDTRGECSAREDLEYAAAVCKQLKVELHTVNFSSEYWDSVFQVTLAEYRAGRTPNPDILCNQTIKFSEFLQHAKALGADKIATGHYAGILKAEDQYHLLKGRDSKKDQSYFLHRLNQAMLSASVFPLAEMEKSAVRRIAQEQQLKPAQRKDSVGICFIGKRNFYDFLKNYLPEQQGDIVDENNKLVGKHQGAWFYTIGQRQGLGIGGTASQQASQPWYVAGKDIKNNRLFAVQSRDHPLLFKQTLQLEQVHWITRPMKEQLLRARIRHQQDEQTCTITEQDKGLQVYFEKPQWGVAPGQSVVFYAGRYCLGGGVIHSAR